MSGAATARRRSGKDRADVPRLGLALAGGGPLGGIYEVGALLALSDMFFANIFSYAHREKLCEAVYRGTRRTLLARQAALSPLLTTHGVRLNLERLREARRSIADALTDPRPLLTRARGVRQSARDVARTLDHLEAWLAAASAT